MQYVIQLTDNDTSLQIQFNVVVVNTLFVDCWLVQVSVEAAKKLITSAKFDDDDYEDDGEILDLGKSTSVRYATGIEYELWLYEYLVLTSLDCCHSFWYIAIWWNFLLFCVHVCMCVCVCVCMCVCISVSVSMYMCIRLCTVESLIPKYICVKVCKCPGLPKVRCTKCPSLSLLLSESGECADQVPGHSPAVCGNP